MRRGFPDIRVRPTSEFLAACGGGGGGDDVAGGDAAKPTKSGYVKFQVSGNETLMISAAGASVLAFSKSIAAAAKATITSPAEPPSGSPYLMINRAQDFAMSWTGGGSGSVQIGLYGSNGSTFAVCKFAASAGTGSVPTAALAALPAGTGSFAMAAITEAEVVAGDYAITVSTYFNAVWLDNSIVSGPAMLQ